MTKRESTKNPVCDDPYKHIKRAIWAYFLLVLFEGGLRKWLLPALATPLLVIRDPIAIWILFAAWKRGLLFLNKYLIGMFLISAIGICTAILAGHGNFVVAIYGARIFLFHFPLIFVIGRVFYRKDVINLGKAFLWISIPMAFLITAQFYSPQASFVNLGVGGDEAGSGFSGALGFFRPSGTFSFTNGTTLFFGLTAAFIIYFWLNPREINRLLLIASTAALLAAIPLSISRSLLFLVILNVLFALLASSRKPEYIGSMILAIAGSVIALLVLSNTIFFQTATEAFTNRFETANEIEGGLQGVFLDRYLGGMIGALQQSASQPFFGFGIGMGTNVGSMLLSGKVEYLISEGEWGRLIGELGPLMGLGAVLIRIGICIEIAINSYKKLVTGDLLPWMLLAFLLTNIPQGQWGQTTALGFSVIIGGLIIAAMRKPNNHLIAKKNVLKKKSNKTIQSSAVRQNISTV